MKWLKIFTVRKRALEGRPETGATDDSGSQQKHTKRRSMQHERKERTSIEQWHEARKSRTSIDICAAFNVTTTERLSVCKAGITLLINRTYIVIKHLGSGSSGQVKLAFNLRSKKLVAIKAVRKGSYAGGGGASQGMRDARSYDGRSSHSSVSGGSSGLTASQSVGVLTSGPGGSTGGPTGGSGGGASGKSWRSITPSSFLLRRSTSAGLGSSTALGASSRGGSPPSSSPSPPPMRRFPGSQNAAGTGNAAAAVTSACGPVEDFVREIAILKRLSHPNIVQLVEVIDDPASDCLLLVMGYVEGSTLQPQQLQPGRWRPVLEEVVWRYARDVLCGLEYLHCHGVVHGDLKPANFIQDSLTGVVRILDFGSAVLHGRVVGEDGLRGAHVPMSCTPGFRSPESLTAGYRSSFELDMWALGVCLYLWIFGELPFKGSAPFVVYENIRSAPLLIPTHTRISAQLNDILTRLLDKDPDTRMTVQEAVVHPWTTAQGLAPLRTPSPLVMAARVQMGMHLAAVAAAAEAQAASGTGASTGAAANGLSQRQQEPRRQGSIQLDSRQFIDTVGTASSATAADDVTTAIAPRQPPASAIVTAVPTPALLSCSSSSVNLMSSAADAATAAVELLLNPGRSGRSMMPLAAAATTSSERDVPEQPWTAAAPSTGVDGPWRMSAGTTTTAPSSTAQSPARSLTGMTAPSYPSHQPPALSPFPGLLMPRIAEGGSTGNTGSLGLGLFPVAMAGGGSTGGRRTSSEAWELRRSVTDEELQAAISSCCDLTGSAAVLMESIFSEVTFPAKQQIICAGDPLDRIYLIKSGEVEIYHDLMQDGPDAPCPHKPIIEGLSDPESELDDPGDFLNIRLPVSNVPQLERLSTGLLNFTAGGDRSNHGGSLAVTALAATFTDSGLPTPGLSALASNRCYSPMAPPVTSPIITATGAYGGGTAPKVSNSCRTLLTGLGAASGSLAGGQGSGGREQSGSSMGLFSRAGTQTGHLIVALKGPGDSLGFAGMLPGGASSSCSAGGRGGGDGGASSSSCTAAGHARQPVWSANVRARTQVTAFVASIESLHMLARAHPQVEPLLQQMVVQQETDLAVAEAMRSLRLIGGAAVRCAPPDPTAGGSAGPASAAASAATAASGSGTATAGATMDVAVVAAVATSAPRARCNAQRGSVAGCVSSEGESESFGMAVTQGTELTAGSPPGSALPQALVSSMSVSEWHQRSSSIVNAPRITRGLDVEGYCGVGTGGRFWAYDMVESNEDVEDVDDVVMISGELL